MANEVACAKDCFNDYLVITLDKNLVRQVVNSQCKPLILGNVNFAKFNIHTSVKYDYLGIFHFKMNCITIVFDDASKRSVWGTESLLSDDYIVGTKE